ncbi:hypothetical protein ACP70R_004003 [Stipagrostis hirtigluma subsp. patula]
MARFFLTALLLVLFAAGQQSHAFVYFIRYNGRSSAVPAREDVVGAFYHEDALRVGQNLSLRIHSSVRAPLGFLPRHVADSIPFSMADLPGILAQFGVAAGSDEAAKMEETLALCEAPSPKWEAKFCATSVESLVEGTMAVLGTRGIREIMPNSKAPRSGAPLQPYRVVAIRPVEGSTFVGCHPMHYPYAVYVCHSTGPARAYVLGMESARGDLVNVTSVCHTDTSEWDTDHFVFKLLGTVPGGPPICHIMPYGHIMWTKKHASLSPA